MTDTTASTDTRHSGQTYGDAEAVQPARPSLDQVVQRMLQPPLSDDELAAANNFEKIQAYQAHTDRMRSIGKTIWRHVVRPAVYILAAPLGLVGVGLILLACAVA